MLKISAVYFMWNPEICQDDLVLLLGISRTIAIAYLLNDYDYENDHFLSNYVLAGQEQADITGQRISELVKHMKTKTPKDENGNPNPLTVNFVKSTMTRATQTANIILKHFPDVNEHQSCDLIREGAPCPPDPPFPEWDPTPAVSFKNH